MTDANRAAQAQIDALLRQFAAASSYSRPSSFSGYTPSYVPIDRSLPIGKMPVQLNPKDFYVKKKKKEKDSGINFWDVLSGTIGQPSGMVTDWVYNSINAWKEVGDKDNKTGLAKELFNALVGNSFGGTVGKGIVEGGKQQWDNWTDGKATWGDIPLVGVLNGMDKHWKRGDDIMEDIAGVDNKWGKMLGGLALDIGLDPQTYLTLGLSAAGKMGKAAEVAEIANQAKKLGIAGKFKNADEFAAVAKTALNAKYAKYPNLVEKMTTKKLDEVMNAIKGARATAFNKNINTVGMSLPFSNKVAAVGTQGEKFLGMSNPLFNSEAKIGNSLVQDLLSKSSMEDSALKDVMERVIKARYGVDDVSELTKTQFDDLHGFLKPLIDSMQSRKGIPDVEIVSQIIEKVMPPEDFAKLMNNFRKQNITWDVVKNQLNEILLQTGDNPALRSSVGAQLAEMVSNYWATTTKGMRGISKADRAARAQSMKWAANFLKDSDTIKTVKNTVVAVNKNGNPVANAAKDARDVSKTVNNMLDNKYDKLSNAKSTFEHFLDRHNPFDARTLGTGDKLLNSMADHIADAQSQRIGENAMFSKDLSKLQKFLNKGGYTQDEIAQQMKEAIYVLEKKAPEHYGKNWKPSTRVQELANTLKPILNKIADNDIEGGVLSGIRKNYFPHVVNKTDEDMEKLLDFVARNPLNGLKSTSGFDKERKGFQTIADRDNYIKDLEKAIQKETDPDTIESLRSKQEAIANMFDTDVVSALQRRIKEGVRAKAMKAMQGELQKFGMMKTIKKGSGDAPPSGLKKLDPDEAKKLGLGDGTHYMHEKVLDGLKRVDEIFTNQGMNKTARFVSAIGDIWRPLVTYYKPAHYLNNMIGNSINNMAAGVRVRDVKNATKLLKNYRSGNLTDEELKIMKAAYKHNVVSGGFLFDSKPNFEFDKPMAIEEFAKKIGDNKGIRKIRKAGEVIDDVSRLANFLHGIDKYGNTAKAARQVREYLFNYNELTNADRAMRVVVPFWNWTKNNIPLQMKLLMENPKVPLNVERFKDYWNKDEKGQDWQKETGLHLPFTMETTDKEGNVRDTEFYTSLPSPTNDLNMLLNPSEFLGGMTPALKIPLEVTMNKKLYTGKPISYGHDDVQSEDMLEYLMSNLGIGNNAYQTISGDKTAFENIMGMLRPVSRVNPNQ